MRLAFELHADGEPSDSNENQKAFQDRILEFWDVVNISFSTSSDDKYVTTYKSFAPPQFLNRKWLWCPVVETTRAHGRWLEYSPRVREAMRLAFRRGLGLMFDFHQYERFDDWLKVLPGFKQCAPLNLGLISEEAKTTKQYSLAKRRMELILFDIYKQAEHVPYHPLFNRSFIEQLAAQELHEVTEFLDEFCRNHDLKTEAEIAYLADLFNDATHSSVFDRSEVVSRAQAWFRSTQHGNVWSPSSPLGDEPSPNKRIHEHSLPSLSPADRIWVSPFSPNDAIQLALKLEMINEEGVFILGERKLGAVVGFCSALKQAEKLAGSIPDLIAVIASLFNVVVKTRQMTSGVAKKYKRLTLGLLKKTN